MLVGKPAANFGKLALATGSGHHSWRCNVKQAYSAERVVLILAGAAGSILSLTDLFGLLDLPFLQKSVPKLTLLLVGLTLTLLSTTALTRINAAARKVEDLQRKTEESSKDISGQLAKIQASLDLSTVARLPELLESVDPALLNVFRPYLEEVFRTPPRILSEKRFRLHQMEAYRSYHRRTLEENPGCTFFATSLPYRKWFWRTDYLERSMASFIANGGRIVRIFFIPEEDSVSSLEPQEVMAAQARIGVEVYTLETSRIPPDLRRFFLVEESGRLAWEAVRGPDDQVASIDVTADSKDIRDYIARFDQLKRVATRYLPGRYISQQISAAEGAQMNTARDPEAFRQFEYAGWEGSVERYHAAWGRLTSQTAKPMLDALSVMPGTAFLDVASGPGYIAAEAERRGAKAIALDFSPSMIEMGRHAYPSLEFRQGDAQQLPFPDASFDSVAMNFGILHLGEPERAIKEAFRVLRPNGRYAFTVWSRPTEAVGFSLVLKAVEDHGEPVVIPHGPDFFYYSRPEECKVALTIAGFASASIMLLDLEWRLSSPDDVFLSFFEGTARTGGLLRQQGNEARRQIRQRVGELAKHYQTDTGDVVIPMPAILASGIKH